MDLLISFIIGGMVGTIMLMFFMGCYALNDEDVQEYLKMTDEEKISKGSEWTRRE